MFRKIRKNFTDGIEEIKWFAKVFTERLKIEVSIIRIMHNSDEISKKRGELLKTIGERVYELRERQEKNIYKDKTVVEALNSVSEMEKEMTELRERISELTQVTQ